MSDAKGQLQAEAEANSALADRIARLEARAGRLGVVWSLASLLALGAGFWAWQDIAEAFSRSTKQRAQLENLASRVVPMPETMGSYGLFEFNLEKMEWRRVDDGPRVSGWTVVGTGLNVDSPGPLVKHGNAVSVYRADPALSAIERRVSNLEIVQRALRH